MMIVLEDDCNRLSANSPALLRVHDFAMVGMPPKVPTLPSQRRDSAARRNTQIHACLVAWCDNYLSGMAPQHEED
jgi:hypothetical protein